jgi:hypothetical protein
MGIRNWHAVAKDRQEWMKMYWKLSPQRTVVPEKKKTAYSYIDRPHFRRTNNKPYETITVRYASACRVQSFCSRLIFYRIPEGRRS